MGYKLNRIMMRPNGVEKQVRPTGWKPGANTIAYYNFEQNLDDSSGNGRTASGANIGYEQVGGQYVVTNTATNNSYIAAPAINGSGITDFTISFWLYPVNPGNRQPLIFAQSEGTVPYRGPDIFFGPDHYGHSWFTNSLLFRMNMNNQQITGDISLNTRHHVVFTRNSGTCKAYVDGSNVLTWTDTTTWGNPDQTFLFNSTNDAPNQGWGNLGAKMDKCKYETIGWSSTDVINDYNTTKSIYGVS